MALTSQLSFPWPNNAVGDGRTYTDAEWSRFWNDAFLGGNEASEGVIRGLAISGTSSPLTVASGSAIVKGVFYNHGVSEAGLTVSTPSVGTTGGIIVAKLDKTAQTVRVVANRNTDGNSAIPALTQTTTVWEIPLATFSITTGGVITLTDARGWAHFSTKVSTAMLDDLAVTAAKIADGTITSAKIQDGTIATGDIANDAVDYTKVGTAVPMLIKRQGGSATDWNVTGTTNYNTGAVVMKVGSVSVAGGAGLTTVTFDTPFSAIPIVIWNDYTTANGVYLYNVTASQIQFGRVGAAGGAVPAFWLAIGPD